MQLIGIDAVNIGLISLIPFATLDEQLPIESNLGSFKGMIIILVFATRILVVSFMVKPQSFYKPHVIGIIKKKVPDTLYQEHI